MRHVLYLVVGSPSLGRHSRRQTVKMKVQVSFFPVTLWAGCPLSRRSSASTPVTGSVKRTVTCGSFATGPNGGEIDASSGGSTSVPINANRY